MLFYRQLINKIRRFYLVHFRKEYVRKQLSLRQGQCQQCGRCCSLVYRCPLLTKDGLCITYGKWRPAVCKVFPIDQRDIDEIATLGGKCGYSFEGAE